MAQRRRPVNVPLIDPAAADASRVSGQGHLFFNRSGDGAPFPGHFFFDFLLNADQVRLDQHQLFVSREDEDFFVASFHFPSKGKARQVKFRVPIRDILRQFHGGDSIQSSPGVDVFTDQALADFEQLWVNFVHVALLVLSESAVLLAEQNLKQRHPTPVTSSEEPAALIDDADDGREEYIINVSNGWPLIRPRFKLHDVVRLHKGSVNRDVESGYLVRVSDLAKNETAEGTVFGDAVAAHRKTRAEETLAAQNRPAPTDAEEILATSEGREIRDQLAEAFAGIATKLFPSPIGRPLALSAEAREALIAELLEDYYARRARHAAGRRRTTRVAIFAEMAIEGKYGPDRESLTAPTIERYLKGRMSDGRKRRK